MDYFTLETWTIKLKAPVATSDSAAEKLSGLLPNNDQIAAHLRKLIEESTDWIQFELEVK